MKALRFLIPVLVFGLVIAGCKGGPEKKLIGKWKLTGMEMKATDSMTKAAIDATIKKGMYVEFAKDGKFITPEGKTGTYSIDKEGKKLTTDDGTKEEVTIGELTETNLSLIKEGETMKFSKEKK